ncbi:MAG: 5'-methylthioadenosine/adenosylhomocysteine nucleosidase [Oscillospiraceae bacterium]|nr:5'-methylthioadenosine/adenosylhomocysteine nucleosidase [Oscillospiraceae bacterium]
MKWGIIGAMDSEVELIKSSLTDSTDLSLGFVTFTQGKYKNEEIVICSSGIGTVNAAVNAQLMIERFNVDCIINTGIAGAADDRLGVMDVVVSSEVIYHDRAEDPYTKFPPYKISFDANKALIERAEKAITQLHGKAPMVGRIATGDVFVTDSALKASIVEKCHPLCVEMEGAAIAQVAFMNSLPFIIVRTMSDSADDEGAETYDNFFAVAAQRSGEILLKMFEMGSIEL